ncbi:hypothetical protein E8K88_02750 [Lampropedia aestuarii]|uniref:Uncharacterized protein n=1 Tax=Lampropedia aestuarii TaxID=2562762 RepID=A0A4S5BU35_9BURK|nr:hypothetical protein [Lampropedia aestuarii]THJ36200.1 hypothetical protein E8K88_02750 [Lampropedia aestuarii]
MVEINLFALLNWFAHGFFFGCGFVVAVMLTCLIWHFLKWLGLDDKPKKANAAQPVSPVLYASPEQLAAFQDKDSKFGSYLPLRKTPVGKFTQPLYTSPPSASSADSQGDTES